ncbi:hypothetical protein [Actinokineospora sp.]|uniref:hypothetical protein n=1 Tax=Actinokineospora sp. TaxID=1872133 RepID=UPI00403830B5
MESNNGYAPIIALPNPRRSWLLHCTDSDRDLGVCEVAVNDGTVLIAGPDNEVLFTLEMDDIALFRAALDAAIEVAEHDLRTRRPRLLPRDQTSPGRTSPVS